MYLHFNCSVYIHNIVQMNLGPPVTLVWMSLNHPVLLACWQVSVGDDIECFEYTDTPILFGSGCVISVVSCILHVCNLLWQ